MGKALHRCRNCRRSRASWRELIGTELSEQLARRRATVAPAVTAEVKRQIAAISEWLAAGEPLVKALLDLGPAVGQFEPGTNPHGYTVYHRELPEAVNVWTKQYQGGCDVAALRERWKPIADTMK